MKDTRLLWWALEVSSSAARDVGASSESDEQARLPKMKEEILKFADSRMEWDDEASLEDLWLLLQ